MTAHERSTDRRSLLTGPRNTSTSVFRRVHPPTVDIAASVLAVRLNDHEVLTPHTSTGQEEIDQAMPEATITKRLRAHLNEVYFVFRHLPEKLLGIARRMSAPGLRDYFIEKARAVSRHQARLLAALMAWGEPPGPCACDEVSEQLNELRYTAKANRGADIVLERATRAANRLAALVRKRLFEALRLSRSIREDALAGSIEELIELERDAHDAPAPSS